MYPYSNAAAADSGAFNPHDSETDIPLNPGEDAPYQRWDAQGRAVGFTGDPTLYSPTPQAPGRIPTFRTESGHTAGGGRYDPPSAAMRERADGRARVQARQESAESASWDTQNQGMGADAYRLPTMPPHSPLTSGLSHTATLPVQLVDPFASTEEFAGQPAQTPTYPQTATHPQYQPPAQGPAQYAAYQLTDGPAPGPLPSPNFSTTPQGRAQAPSGADFYTHAPGATDSSYYTPTHSRYGTEDPILPPPPGPGRSYSPAPPTYRTNAPPDLG